MPDPNPFVTLGTLKTWFEPTKLWYPEKNFLIFFLAAERSVKDHPHHSLPLLLALANSYEDDNFNTNTTQRLVIPNKVTKAQRFITKCKKTPGLASLVIKMDSLSKTFIQVANVDSKSLGNNSELPEYCKIDQLINLHSVAVPTLCLAYDKTCQYKNIVGVKKIFNTFNFVGGITRPKKMICLGTDGVKRYVYHYILIFLIRFYLYRWQLG